jgi:hypothetical protein
MSTVALIQPRSTQSTLTIFKLQALINFIVTILKILEKDILRIILVARTGRTAESGKMMVG